MHPVSFLATFVRPGGDAEELKLTFAVPQAEVAKALPVLVMGHTVLRLTITQEDMTTVKGRFVAETP